jgi:hypothetical protein
MPHAPRGGARLGGEGSHTSVVHLGRGVRAGRTRSPDAMAWAPSSVHPPASSVPPLPSESALLDAPELSPIDGPSDIVASDELSAERSEIVASEVVASEDVVASEIVASGIVASGELPDEEPDEPEPPPELDSASSA